MQLLMDCSIVTAFDIKHHCCFHQYINFDRMKETVVYCQMQLNNFGFKEIICKQMLIYAYTFLIVIYQAEKPDTTLAVICGSLHVADRTILDNFHNFQTSLEK